MRLKQYWLHVIVAVAITILLAITSGIFSALGHFDRDNLDVVTRVLDLALICRLLYLGFYRCEDIGCNTAWALSCVVPLGVLILGCIPGETPDKYK